jgi:hypothetical protein
MTATTYTSPYAETAPPRVEVVPSMGRHVSWGAVFAGVMIVLAVQLLLSMLGLGIGLSTVNPSEGGTPNVDSLGIGAAVWWVISYLLVLLAGGYVAARLAPSRLTFDGALHGILTWAFALLLTFYLLTTAIGGVIGSAFSAVGSALSAAEQMVKDAVPQAAQAAGVTPDVMQQGATALINAQSTSTDPKSLSREQAQQEIAANLPKLATGGDQAQQAHDRIVAVMAAQLNIAPAEANQRLDKIQSQVAQTTDEVKDKAKQAADKTASGLSKASMTAFVSLLLGAPASAIGGSLGVRRDADIVRT